MQLTRSSDLTPCGALFEVLKRYGGISHKELASMILSERPLSDGRSPASRAADRTWVSRSIVHAPAGAVQERYFRDYGIAAQRIVDRLHARRAGGAAYSDMLRMICGAPGEMMVRALETCQGDTRLYRNALERMREGEGYTAGERAEAAMVLFVAAGCSASVTRAVDYTTDYIRSVMGGRLGTPTSCPVPLDVAREDVDVVLPCALGLVRVEDGRIAGGPYWVPSDCDGADIGALATGPVDITDVAGDVSARHARVRYEDAAPDGSGSGRWMLRDLGSSNGTAVVDGGTGASARLVEGVEVEVHPGDEVILGSGTTFILVEGAASVTR